MVGGPFPVTQVMLLLYVLLAYVKLGSSASFPEKLCYGDTYKLPMHFLPALYNKTITFTPKGGDPKIIVNAGQSLDSRFKVSRTKIEMANLSERDNEATLSIESHIIFDTVMLRVKNCRSVVKKLCGDVIFWNMPYDAEYLEFSGPDVNAPPTILWNRTTRSSIRGKVSGSLYQIKDLTQRDSGYYRFRGPNDKLQKFEQIVVEANSRSYDFDEGKVKLQYPLVFRPAKVTFLPNWNSRARTVTEDSRLDITDMHLAFNYATPEDSGTYDFFDKDGNLILRMTLEIREVEKVWVSVAVLAAISFGFALCCCCLKKFCCTESSDKTSSPESEPEAASPTVYNHGTQTTEPETPLLPREPTVIFPDPPSYNEAGGHIDPPPPYEECNPQPSAPPVPTNSTQPDNPDPAESSGNSSEPTVSAAEVKGATDFSVNSFDLNTDSDPHFELRGTTVPSASPLSADGSSSAEYTSDKFNFL